MFVFLYRIKNVIALLIVLLIMPLSSLAFSCGCNNINNDYDNKLLIKKRVVEIQPLYCQGINYNSLSKEQKIRAEHDQTVSLNCCGDCMDKSIQK